MKRVSKILFVLAIAITTCIGQIKAQSKIRGIVYDVSSKPLADVNVLLLNASDSSLVKGLVTKETGNYVFENITTGRYLIAASFIGFEQVYSSLLNISGSNDDIDAGSLKLQKAGSQLAEVKVVAKKPLFEQKADRMIINVKSSITSAGSTALQVLEKSPGVSVNRQNSSISLNGKSGINVMINGKRNYMPLSAVFQLLEGMSANNIEKIELITTPPSSMDAEGNAGFINIVMANDANFGTNGSYSISAGYGRGPVTAASLNLNHRKGKFNLYGDYSFSLNGQEQDIDNYRKVVYKGNTIENYVHSDREPLTIVNNLRFGIDYQLTPKTIIGALFNGYQREWTMDAVSNISINKNSLPDTLLKITTDELNRWKSLSANINLQHKFTPDEMITADFDYVYYSAINPISYDNGYSDGSGNFLFDRKTKTDKVTPIRFYVGKADYLRKLNKKVSMEAGVKAAFSTFSNDISVSNYISDKWITDESLSAKYKLEETIAAVYTSFNITASEKTTIKAGLRYEYTVSNLGSEKEKNIVDRKYGNLFPTLFVSHKINENNSFNLAYSRRINRPTFTDMAPFLIFLDPNTFFAGNSKLQPSITNTVNGSYAVKRYIFSLTYSYDKDPIALFQNKVDSVNNKQTTGAENLKNMQTLTLTIAVPFRVSNWWNSQNSVTGSWQQINLIYNKSPLQLEQKSYTINSTQTFILPREISLELSLLYLSPQLMGSAKMKPLWQLGFGAQKKIGDKKGTLRFNVNDIFNTFKYNVSNNYPEQNLVTNFKIQFMPRYFSLTYSRNFGNDKLNGKRNRGTGSDDEKARVRQ